MNRLRWCVIAAITCAAIPAFGAIYTSNGTGGGNWGAVASWAGPPALAPGSGDDVIIQAGDLITLFDTRSVNSVTIQDGGILRVDGGSTLSVLTGGTSIQINAPSGAGTSTLLFNGGIVTTAGGINVTGSASGNASIDFTASGGTLTVGTDLLFPFGSNAQITFNNAGTINIGGNLGANGTITTTNSTFVFNGTGAQSILGSYTFFNLTINKSNTLTLNNPIWVNGTLFVQNGLFDDGGNQISLNPGLTSTVQINSNGVLKLGSAASGTAFPNPLNPANVVLASNAAVSYHAGVTQTIRDDFNYKRLFVGNIGAGGVTHLLLGDLVVEEVLDITDGGSGSTVLNIGANPLDVNGNITGTGSLSTTGSQINVGGNWGSAVDFSPGTSNVTYDGSGAQSVRGTTYHSLTIAKSAGTATLGAATTVQNDLTITSGTLSTGGFALDVADFFNNAGVFDAGSSIVTLNGDVTNSGTFNSSSATFKLDGTTTQLITTSSGITLSTLEINNSTIVTLAGAGTYSVNGTLNLYGGVVTVNGTAGSFFVDVLATVNRTTGWINGYLTMGMNPAPARRFHVGTAGVYLPVDVDSGSGGTLTVAALDGQHPDRTADNVLHRYWRLTTPSTVTAIDSLTFNYNAGDVVIGNETLYHLASYNSGTLTFTHYGDVVNEGAHTATAATPVSFLEDWLVGQPGSMAAASKLGITAINGGSNPSAGVPFQVDVQAQDDDGSPTDVFSATTVTLSLDSGTGTLGGTLSGIIAGGTDFVTISGVTYDTAEAGVQIRATASLGDDLADATSTFTVNAAPSTLTVSNLNDSGPGSLRAAITAHNSGSCTTPCTINFSVAGTINLSTALPAITVADLTIDGFTAPGASANTNAFGLASNAVLTAGISGTTGILTGFEIAESNVVIKGMAIMNFSDTGAAGVKITGVNTGSGVSGCHIGVDLSGTTSAPNYDGVLFTGSTGASLGGTSPADRNVISGNSRSGVWITGASNSITLTGNYIGTNRGLTAALPNADGVYIGAGASAAIGQSGTGNVISGNSDDAIVVTSPGSTIVANLIGPAGSSTTALANGTGIRLESGATNTVIGGASPSETNTISGNTGNGIEILASSCDVDYNRIGIAPDGTTVMGNGASGIRLEDPASDNLIGETFANKIANNGADGVSITGTGIGNVVRENQIFSNTNLAIDLADDGITANDATDSDTGPNNRQNFPTISAARLNVTNIDVTFSLNSSSGVSANFFRFDVYKADNSATPQALDWLGDAGCVAGNVFASQIISVPAGSATVGNKVVVAATAYSDAACSTPSEGTSELSAAATIGGDIHWIAG
ncbi:MAG TPA: right-handed parallel beta-helix repeat-containing protein, partial [Thermoanaerobaculia bacterium]|nr:right-handed parallel beta-helix repeat-containing protein [Thermoanaerobaculia bacterium]